MNVERVEIGPHTLYCGDFRRVVSSLEFDAVITDPPFGISHKSHGQIFADDEPIVGDEDTSLALEAADAVGSVPLAMFFSPYRPLPIAWRSVLVWNKGPQVGIGGDRATCWKRDFELIGVCNNRPLNGKRDSAVLDFPSPVIKESGHFCEKPVRLMRYLTRKLTNEGQTVFDPFMGTGAGAVACQKSGRRFIGCELNPTYFRTACRRIEDALHAEPLFSEACA